MKSDGRLCLFTGEGNMYQVKASAIPRCRIRDKGTLIHNLCKVDRETILTYISFEELFESQLLFVTKAGFIKQVSGIEFETNRSVVASTKLDPDDGVVAVIPLSAAQITGGELKVILLTQDGLSLGFPLPEVPEQKKNGRGVRGITLEKADTVAFAAVAHNTAETFEADGKLYSAKKVRNRKRGGKGQRASLQI